MDWIGCHQPIGLLAVCDAGNCDQFIIKLIEGAITADDGSLDQV